MGTILQSLKRAFVTGAALPSGNMLVSSGDPHDSFAPPQYGDYLATSADVYVAANYRARQFSSVPLKLYRRGRDGQRAEVTRGPLVDLLAKVNPYWTGRRLFQMTELSLCLWGSAFWFLDRGQGGRGEPREIWWARPDRVTVIPHPTDYISHFEYDAGTGQPLIFGRHETFWARYPNPLDEWSGLAPIAAARIAADTASAAMRSNVKLFDNGLQLAGFVTPKTGEVWTQEQAEQIEEALKRRFQGVTKAHRWAVLKRETQFMPLSVSAKDAEYLGALAWSFETVCRVYGIPPDLLGGKRTYQNSAEARLALWEDTMKPECAFIADELTEQLLPLFPGQADIAEFDLSDVGILQEAESAKWDRWREQIERGAKTVNEYRETLGDDPVAWGDAWWAPVSLTPISTAEQAEPPEPEPAPAEQPPGDDAPEPTGPRSRTRAIEYGGAEHQRLWDAHVRRVDPWERRFGELVKRLMLDQRKSILAKLTKREADPAGELAANPFDKPRFVRKFREEARPVLREIIREAGTAALADLALSASFNVFDPRVVRFLEQRAQRFAVEVNATTWDMLRASLADGLEAGESITELAARVETVMGERIRSSATTIARTEVAGASQGGALEAARQSGVVQGKTWVAALDERTRDSHVQAHNQTVPLDDNFLVGAASGPAPGQMGAASEDVNCRCAMTFVLDTQEMPT